MERLAEVLVYQVVHAIFPLFILYVLVLMGAKLVGQEKVWNNFVKKLLKRLGRFSLWLLRSVTTKGRRGLTRRYLSLTPRDRNMVHQVGWGLILGVVCLALLLLVR
jgi:hypothetical protein